MSKRLAQRLWGDNDTLTPIFLTASRKSLSIPLQVVTSRVHQIVSTETSVVLARKRGKKLGNFAVFPSIETKQMDVTARALERNPDHIEESAAASLVRAMGSISFRLIALDPYLRVDSYLNRRNTPVYPATIVFPFAAIPTRPIQGRYFTVDYLTAVRREAADPEWYNPTFIHDAKAAIEALTKEEAI